MSHSVSNYGFGGAIAHAILEKAPAATVPIIGASQGSQPLETVKDKIFVLSGSDPTSVTTKMKELGIFLEQRPEVFEKALPGRLAYTLASKRSHLPYKIAFVADSADDLGGRLAVSKLKPTRSMVEPAIVMVFTGQGAQWAGMGQELMQSHPIFKSTMESADAHLRSLGAPYSLIEELQKKKEDSIVDAPYISQPACTAIQIALTVLLAAWNIKPVAVVGHSSGEIGAAFAAGIISKEDALALAYHRGNATVHLKKQYPDLKGRMLAVGSDRATIEPLLKTLEKGYATVACINSPTSVTVSGDEDAINELTAILELQKTFARKLRVDVAYHSKHMARVADSYREAIKRIKPRASTAVTMYSSLFGRVAEATQLDADYWVSNLVYPVEFDSAVQAMCSSSEAMATKSKYDIIVEVGPHGALEGPLKDILKTLGGTATKTAYVSALTRNSDATKTTLQLAATLYMKGASLDFQAINFPISGAQPPAMLTDLPKYPWNHTQKYWHESRISDNHRFKKFPRHDILGVLADYSNDLEPTWRNIICLEDLPWLRHHKMQSMIVFPIAGYMAMAMLAAAQRAQMRNVAFDRFDMREIVTSRALILDETNVETTITLRPFSEGTRSYSDIWDEFRISSWTNGKGWTEHCRGLIAVRNGDGANAVDGVERLETAKKGLSAAIAEIHDTCDFAVDSANMYETLTKIGAIYGEAFQGLEKCYACGQHARAEIVVPDTSAMMPHNYETSMSLHPTTFDDFIQVVWPILGAGRIGLDTLHMPSSIAKATVLRQIPNVPGDRLLVYGSGVPTPEAPKPTKFTLIATTMEHQNEAVIYFDGLVMTPILDSVADHAVDTREVCFQLDWQALDEPEQPRTEAVNGVHEVVNGVNGINGDAAHSESSVADSVHHSVLAEMHSEIAIISEPGAKQLATDLAAKLAASGVKKITTGALGMETLGKVCVILQGLESPRLSTLSANDFDRIKEATRTAAGILWAVRGVSAGTTLPESDMVVGLARSVRSETSLPFATLSLACETVTSTDIACNSISKVLETVFDPSAPSSGVDMEFIERNGHLLVPRITNDTEMNNYIHREIHKDIAPYLQDYSQPGRRLKLKIGIPGMLDTLCFTDDNTTVAPLLPDEVEIEVRATGMNFKDVVCVMGSVSNPKDYLGVECSGVIGAVGSNVTDVQVGDRVLAMSEGAYSTVARCLHTSVAKIPEGMDFETACTIPVVYCTAYYAIHDLARMERGESILIHAAAGGVGQAAISLCKHLGAEIYATVGSAAKKQFLMDTYGLAADRIFYSRDTSFGMAVRQATNGHGVDVVLNSLAGDVLRESWNCLAHFGRFIEIGKRDITNNTRLEMSRFSHNATFASIDLTIVAMEKPRLMQRILRDVANLLSQGSIKAISPVTVYPISDLETAFRTLQSGKNVGKLVVVPKPGDQVKVSLISFMSSGTKLTSAGNFCEEPQRLAEPRCHLPDHRWYRRSRAEHVALDGHQGRQAHYAHLKERKRERQGRRAHRRARTNRHDRICGGLRCRRPASR